MAAQSLILNFAARIRYVSRAMRNSTGIGA